MTRIVHKTTHSLHPASQQGPEILVAKGEEEVADGRIGVGESDFDQRRNAAVDKEVYRVWLASKISRTQGAVEVFQKIDRDTVFGLSSSEDPGHCSPHVWLGVPSEYWSASDGCELGELGGSPRLFISTTVVQYSSNGS